MKEIDVNKGKIIECARLPVALALVWQDVFLN